MSVIVVAHFPVVTAPILVRIAGLVGGLCWVGRAVLDTGAFSAGVIDALHYGGLALMVIALLGMGAELVSGLVALRVVVAICLVALAWAIVSFLHQQYSDRVVDGILGGLFAAYCLAGIVARRRPDDGGDKPASHRSPGSHAA
jgi:hypothetical protein